MAKYKKRPLVIEATQWFKNGDHPKDESFQIGGSSTGENFPEKYEREGKIVSYYVNTIYRKDKRHMCGKILHLHGWVETLEGGHIVCPNDWIITGIQGEYYPIKPDIFEKTYEPVE